MAARTKDDWRRRARSVRRADPPTADDQERCRRALARFLADRPPDGRWVVGYRALDGEIDLDPLLRRDELGPFAVTRTPEEGMDLTVHPLGSRTERHRFGFDQPVAEAPLVADDDIAVVLVPGLAFDRLGTRLGHGAGYFDRFLGRLRPGVVTVGVTGGPVVAELPMEAHDVAMTHLCGRFGVEPTPLAEPDG